MDTAGAVTQGLAVIRKHFPEASVGELDPKTALALEAIGRLENPLLADIVQCLDLHDIGIWGGRLGKKP